MAEKVLSIVSTEDIYLQKTEKIPNKLMVKLFSFLELSANLEHIMKLKLSPLAIWNSTFHKIDLFKTFKEIQEYLAYPIPELFIKEVEIEISRAHRHIEIYYAKESQKRLSLNEIEFPKGKPISPREGQQIALNTVLGAKVIPSGVLVLPSGYGKTFLGLMLIKKLGLKVCVIVPNLTLQRQWKEELMTTGGFTKDILSTNELKLKDVMLLTFTQFQKLSKEEYEQIKFVLVDEIHNISRSVLERLFDVPVVLGLTATYSFGTDLREDAFTKIGPKLFEFTREENSQASKKVELRCFEIGTAFLQQDKLNYLVLKNNGNKYKFASTNQQKDEVVKSLYNLFFLSPITEGALRRRKMIIFGEFAEQLIRISEFLNVPLITGKTSPSQRQQIYKKFNNDEITCFISSRVTNEAIDLPSANTIIQISGQKDNGVEEFQRLGRLMRFKDEANLFISIITKNSLEEKSSLNRRIYLEEHGIPMKQISNTKISLDDFEVL